MATTGQQALDRALERSGLNAADLIPTPEILQYMGSYQMQVFLEAAKLNPEYYGKNADTATRAAFGDSWDLSATPGDIASITMAEVKTIAGTVAGIAVGDTINLISRRWPQLHVTPRAYIRNRKLTGYLTELGAADANMVTVVDIFYAELPANPSALTVALRTPDEWIDLIVLPLANTFALRDRRMDESGLIKEEYGQLLATYRQALGVYDGGVTRPINSVPVATALDAVPPPPAR